MCVRVCRKGCLVLRPATSLPLLALQAAEAEPETKLQKKSCSAARGKDGSQLMGTVFLMLSAQVKINCVQLFFCAKKKKLAQGWGQKGF